MQLAYFSDSSGCRYLIYLSLERIVCSAYNSQLIARIIYFNLVIHVNPTVHTRFTTRWVPFHHFRPFFLTTISVLTSAFPMTKMHLSQSVTALLHPFSSPESQLGSAILRSQTLLQNKQQVRAEQPSIIPVSISPPLIPVFLSSPKNTTVSKIKKNKTFNSLHQPHLHTHALTLSLLPPPSPPDHR